MPERVRFEDILRALRQVGIRKGDLLLVHSRLFTLGLVEDVQGASEVPAVYLRAFQEMLGDRGTLVVPTYTTSFGRLGKPFVLEESPSEMGLFSEQVRRTQGSRRSLHPIQSLTALGVQADRLTKDHPRWNVGHDTLWDRMLRLGGKIVTVGIPGRQCMSFVHHVEFLACAPYLYHKILRGEVYARGVRVLDEFLAVVRFLELGVCYDLSRLETDLTRRSAIRRAPLGEDWVEAVPMEAVLETCAKGLGRDSYYLLKRKPSFIEGEVPCDGITAGREGKIPSYFEILR